MSWLAQNLATVVIALLVTGLVALIVYVLIRDKKRCGSCTCGCSGCTGCPMSGRCGGGEKGGCK